MKDSSLYKALKVGMILEKEFCLQGAAQSSLNGPLESLQGLHTKIFAGPLPADLCNYQRSVKITLHTACCTILSRVRERLQHQEEQINLLSVEWRWA